MRNFEKLFYDEHFDQLNNMVRWNGMKRIKDETVAHHSFIVTWFTRVLVEEIFIDDKPKLLATTYAVFHDFDEMFTGDIINPFKYNELNGVDIRKSIGEFVEYKVEDKFPSNGNLTDRMLNNMMTGKIPVYIKKIVKISDWLSMRFYLQKEIDLGNKSVMPQREFCDNNIQRAIDDCCMELLHQKDYNVNLEIFKK